MSSPKPREAQSKGLKCAKKKNNHHNIENRRIKTERQKGSRGREVDSLILDKDYFLSLLDHCCTSLFCGQLNVYRSPQGNLLHRSLPSNLLLLSEGSRSSFTESTIFKRTRANSLFTMGAGGSKQQGSGPAKHIFSRCVVSILRGWFLFIRHCSECVELLPAHGSWSVQELRV